MTKGGCTREKTAEMDVCLLFVLSTLFIKIDMIHLTFALFCMHNMIYRLMWFINVFVGKNTNTDSYPKGFTTVPDV